MAGDLGPPRSDFVEEAQRILEAAKDRAIVLRLMGAVALRIHSPKYGYLQESLGRQFSDIDFVSYSRHQHAVEVLFRDLGYSYDPIAAKVFAIEFGYSRRLTFTDPEHGRHSDIFFDALEFSHIIPLGDRLQVDYPTLPLAELLLSKMQIAKLTKKDVIDTIMLLREHEVGETDKETVNAKRIARLCAADWGFWRTVTGNLNTTMEHMLSYTQLTESDKEDLRRKIVKIIEYLEKEPKPLSWKIRSVVGEKKKWYQDVEEVSRG